MVQHWKCFPVTVFTTPFNGFPANVSIFLLEGNNSDRRGLYSVRFLMRRDDDGLLSKIFLNWGIPKESPEEGEENNVKNQMKKEQDCFTAIVVFTSYLHGFNSFHFKIETAPCTRSIDVLAFIATHALPQCRAAHNNNNECIGGDYVLSFPSVLVN